jgi:Bacteriophage tail sheath protein
VECVCRLSTVDRSSAASGEPTYPGVYVEETRYAARPIPGVSTCGTTSAGFRLEGPLDQAVRVSSFADFERHFGDVPLDTAIAQALEQFFKRGGTHAWVVRAATGSPSASLALLLAQPIKESS